jgi:hypothetical protein
VLYESVPGQVAVKASVSVSERPPIKGCNDAAVDGFGQACCFLAWRCGEWCIGTTAVATFDTASQECPVVWSVLVEGRAPRTREWLHGCHRSQRYIIVAPRK